MRTAVEQEQYERLIASGLSARDADDRAYAFAVAEGEYGEDR